MRDVFLPSFLTGDDKDRINRMTVDLYNMNEYASRADEVADVSVACSLERSN